MPGLMAVTPMLGLLYDDVALIAACGDLRLDGVVLLLRDGLEAKVLAGAVQDGLGAFGVVRAHGLRPMICQPPGLASG